MFVIFLTTDNNYRRPAMGKRVCRITSNTLILKTLNIRKRRKPCLYNKNIHSHIAVNSNNHVRRSFVDFSHSLKSDTKIR